MAGTSYSEVGGFQGQEDGLKVLELDKANLMHTWLLPLNFVLD